MGSWPCVLESVHSGLYCLLLLQLLVHAARHMPAQYPIHGQKSDGNCVCPETCPDNQINCQMTKSTSSASNDTRTLLMARRRLPAAGASVADLRRGVSRSLLGGVSRSRRRGRGAIAGLRSVRCRGSCSCGRSALIATTATASPALEPIAPVQPVRVGPGRSSMLLVSDEGALISGRCTSCS
jgi:hypothetical protein